MSINSFGGITLMSTYKLGLLSPLVAVGSAWEAVHFKYFLSPTRVSQKDHYILYAYDSIIMRILQYIHEQIMYSMFI